MEQAIQPLKSWRSKAGERLLAQLAARQIRPDTAVRRHGLAEWEAVLLQRALRAPQGFASTAISARLRAERRKSLAEKFDLLRRKAREYRPLHPHQSKFRGNRSHLELLRRSVQVPTEDSEWNAWRKRHPRIVPDLRGANLSDLRLGNLYLSSTVLRRADLSGARLGGARLDRCDLRHAEFSGTNLYEADLSQADLRGAWFEDSQLTGANLQGADLRDARLIGGSINKAQLEGADLRDAFLWGTSAWEVATDEHTLQDVGIGGFLFDPIDAAAFRKTRADVRIDDIAVADFIALVSGNRTALARIIDVASSKLVLLLGRFQGKQHGVLLTLENALSDMGYVPIVFDFKEPKDRDLVETVSVLAGLCRFVIADLTNPRSTPLESHLIIPTMAIPFVPIIRGKEQPFSMFAALQRKYRWVLPPIAYASEANLLSKLASKIVEPAEARARQLRRLKHPTAENK